MDSNVGVAGGRVGAFVRGDAREGFFGAGFYAALCFCSELLELVFIVGPFVNYLTVKCAGATLIVGEGVYLLLSPFV